MAGQTFCVLHGEICAWRRLLRDNLKFPNLHDIRSEAVFATWLVEEHETKSMLLDYLVSEGGLVSILDEEDDFTAGLQTTLNSSAMKSLHPNRYPVDLVLNKFFMLLDCPTFCVLSIEFSYIATKCKAAHIPA